MKLVKDHRRDAFQGGILLQHAGEDPFGDHLDAGRSAHPGLPADAVAHRLAHVLAQQGGHIARRWNVPQGAAAPA